jgi:hypothetical protein
VLALTNSAPTGHIPPLPTPLSSPVSPLGDVQYIEWYFLGVNLESIIWPQVVLLVLVLVPRSPGPTPSPRAPQVPRSYS